jgi:ParB-like nuclease domain
MSGNDNRNYRFAKNNPLQEDEAPRSITEADAALYGAVNLTGTDRIKVKKLSIFDIYPDLAQPRRAIPSAARVQWSGTSNTVTEMLIAWWELAQAECGHDIDLRNLVIGDSESQRPEESKPIEASLLALADLAASIFSDGLTNPITVAKHQETYRLETGERRWLAYHLLRWLTGDHQWENIPARVVDQVDIWRQAAENNARQNLNAVGRARQYAILMMAFYPDQAFNPHHECPSDRAYYAQALNLDMPYGQGQKILSTMAITSRSQLTTYRKTLAVADEIWMQADDENWPESKLFSVLNTSSSAPTPPASPLADKKNKQVFNRIWRVLQHGKGTISQKDVNHLHHWLNEVEKRL